MVESAITITVDHVAAKALLEVLDTAERRYQSGYCDVDCRDHVNAEFNKKRQAKIRELHMELRRIFADDKAKR